MSSPIFGIEHILTLESPKVESIAYSVGTDSSDIRIFVAMKGGRLYEYVVKAESRNEAHSNRTYTVTNTISTVASKKKVSKILPIHSISKVFILSNGTVSAFDYATLAPVFCDISVANILDMGINLDTDSKIPHFWILLKKRILLYQYIQGQLIQFNDVPLNDTPLLVSWLEDTLFLQFKDHTQSMNIHTMQLVADLKTVVKNTNQLCMKLLQTQSLLVASSPNSYSCIVREKGIYLKDWSIQLTSAVKRVCYSTPFIYILSDTLQVFDEYTGQLVDSVNLSSPLQLMCDADFSSTELKDELYSFLLGVTNDGDLVIIDLIDSDRYVTELLNRNMVLPAFAILHRNEKIKNTQMDQLECHKKAYLYFLTQLNFEDAFSHAISANIHPHEILHLFPDLVVGSLPEPVVLTKEVIGRNNHAMTDFIISCLKQQSSNPSSINATCDEVKQLYEKSRYELLAYLQNWHATHDLETMIDTAIIHLLLQYQPKLVYFFLSSPTACEESHIQPLLTERGLFSALAQFYINQQQPEKALNLWKQLAEGSISEEGIDGVLLISRYLRNATEPTTLQLIKEFSPFVFDHSIDEAYKIFTLSEVSTEPIYQFILDLLDSLPEEKRVVYRTKYVKYLVMMTHIKEPRLNTEYLQILLAELVEKAAETQATLDSVKLDEIPAGIKDKRMDFYTLLISNAFYDAVTILESIGEKPLWFERIVLLSKLGRFEEALRLTINELKSIKYACECCLKFAEMECGKEQDPWKILLEILFKEEDEVKKQAFREAGVQILENYAYKIDPMMALSILPDDLTNGELHNYYQIIIPHSTNMMREARIQVGMKQVFLEESRDCLEKEKNTFVVIEGDKKCSYCGELFKNEECIALTKNRERVHEKCLSEEERQMVIEMKDLF